jgi:hypothetical protein
MHPGSRHHATLATLVAAVALAACVQPGQDEATIIAADPIPATLLLLTGFDEEGVLNEHVQMPPPGPYFIADTLYAEAGAVAGALDADVAVRGDTLLVNGVQTHARVRRHDTGSWIPVRAVADVLGAFLYQEPEPGRVGTLWPQPLLCRYARGADPRAPVFRAAADQGILARCDPPVDMEAAARRRP